MNRVDFPGAVPFDAQSIGQGIGGVAAAFQQEQERSKPLDPDIQAAIRRVLQGEHPSAVAADVKLRRSGPMMSGPATSGQGAPFLRSFTQGDIPTLKSLGVDLVQRAPVDTPEAKMARLETRIASMESEKGKDRELKATAQDKELDLKRERMSQAHDEFTVKLEQDWNKALLRARTALTAAREGHASTKDVAALKAIIAYDAQINAAEASLAKSTNEMGGAFGTSQEMQAKLADMKAKHAAIAPLAQAALDRAGELVKNPGRGAESSSQSVSGPSVTNPQLPQDELVPVVSPDGKRGKIPASKLGEALKRGFKRLQ